MTRRALAAATGVLWISRAVLRAMGPVYWAPVTPLDFAAVGLFSLAMLGLGLCLWLIPAGGRTRIIARIAGAAAITNSVANVLEDGFALRPFGAVWVLTALLLLVALVALAVILFRSNARALAAVAALSALGFFFTEAGGGALVGAAWLAVALVWPTVIFERATARLATPAGARTLTGMAGLIGGASFIASVVSDVLDAVAFPVFVLLIGIAAAGAYGLYAPSARARSLGGTSVAVTGSLGAGASMLATSAPAGAGLGYVAWFVFITCAVAVSAGVLVLGIMARRRDLMALGLMPVGYLAAVIGVKLALGWWITDQMLQGIGEWSAAALIGGGWMALGVILLRSTVDRVEGNAVAGPSGRS